MEKIICIPTKSGKDCDTCSWGDLTIGDVGMCEMDEVRKAVGKWEVSDE